MKTIELFDGIVLRCFPENKFKQSCLSIQFLRPMCREEVSLNALIPAILLRGTQQAPDLQAIFLRLDDLYGAAAGPLVRRVGDYQTTGLYCTFINDQFAFSGDRVMEPMLEFLGQLLFCPVLENGAFREDYVQTEKRNLILAIEGLRDDKRAYANERLIQKMCAKDNFGLSRLGQTKLVEKITPQTAYAHYRKILSESPIQLIYVGSTAPEQVADMLRPLFVGLSRNYVNLPPQTAFTDPPTGTHSETREVTQGKLCMGFVTPITLRDSGFAAMQVLNMLFGGSMTSKLFMQIREAQSLCYDIGSSYHGSKGVLTVSSGIDFDQEESVTNQVLSILDDCRNQSFTDEELKASKQELMTQLQGIHDSPGSIENYYTSALLSGLYKTPREYMQAVEAVTAEQVAQAASTLQLHTVYFLRGVR